MPKNDYTPQELLSAQAIVDDLSQGHTAQGISKLRTFKDQVYAAIPDKQRQSRGITWVLQRISALLAEKCSQEEQILHIAKTLYNHIAVDDRLIGVPIFLMAAYGKSHPTDVLDFFKETADSPQWEVREFAASGFHKFIKPHRDALHPWLMQMAQSPQPNLRRFVSETLRPVTDNRWLQNEPEYSLSVLRLLFRESHPYPRTSVGNNLSDLSRHNPELIFSIVQELAESGDKNSYWIAYRACRNLVKKESYRVMDLLDVDEYHYKDRNFYREN